MFDCNSTLRYFVESTVWPFSVYLEDIGFLDLVTLIALYVCWWNAMPHFFSHAARQLVSSLDGTVIPGLDTPVRRYSKQV